MERMRNILHFSTVDVDASRIAGVGHIPMPSGLPRVRLFLDGGGVIDLQETREQARDIWLETESKEHRYSRVVEQNAALRLAFDRVLGQVTTLTAERPKEDLLHVIAGLKSTLLAAVETKV